MNQREKKLTGIILVLIILLNLYHGSRIPKQREGFIKSAVSGVMELIPIPQIRDYLKNEMNQGKGGFNTLLTLGVALFKLTILVGVVPFVMFIVAKIVSVGGMATVSSGIMKFATFMISRRKLNLEKMNRAQIQLMNQEIQQLRSSRCCSDTTTQPSKAPHTADKYNQRNSGSWAQGLGMVDIPSYINPLKLVS